MLWQQIKNGEPPDSAFIDRKSAFCYYIPTVSGRKLSGLDDLELCQLLKDEDAEAWQYVLEKVVDQEKRSRSGNLKRHDWGVSLESLIGQLYEEMVGQGKLAAYQGRGSLIGWLRSYLRGYLSRQNPENGRFPGFVLPESEPKSLST